MRISFSLYRYIPYWLKKKLNFEVSVKLQKQYLTIPTAIETGINNVYWKKSWKAEIIERLLPGETGLFVDVGANVGQTLLDLQIVKPDYSYIGFEPNCLCVNYLRQLIQLSALQNYQIFPVGLSDGPKCLPLFRHKDSAADASASMVPNLRPGRTYDVDIVPCFSFDEIRKSLALNNVTFIKIDVEGAELDTVQGMEASIRECQPIILCEVLFADSKSDLNVQDARKARLMQLLTSLHYQAAQVIKSADTAHIVDLKKIAAFPSAYWNKDNKDLCDYLFFPEGKETSIRNALFGQK